MSDVICVLCAVVCAFCLGCNLKTSASKLVKTIFKPKEQKELERQTMIRNQEYINFMNYNGDPQPDPEEVVNHGRR